ncbi:MAG: ComEA family DNA-binding protein [Myxococcaceae bacterium]
MKKLGTWMTMAALAMVFFTGVAEAKGKTKMQFTGQVNLNSANAAQLDALPGVGEKAAKKIIEHRTKTPFNRIEELVKVKGFGKKKFEKLKPYLAISGPNNLQGKRVPNDAPAGNAGQGRGAPQKR